MLRIIQGILESEDDFGWNRLVLHPLKHVRGEQILRNSLNVTVQAFLKTFELWPQLRDLGGAVFRVDSISLQGHKYGKIAGRVLRPHRVGSRYDRGSQDYSESSECGLLEVHNY